MTALVLLSYGRETEYRRAIFTILSFWALNSEKNVNVLVFTDNPSYFAPYISELPVEYILITPEKMKEMKGKMDFIHRVKIAVIEEAFAYLKPDKLLYIDSDTYFKTDPAPLLTQISSSTSAMHEREYSFGEFAASNAPDNNEAKKFVALLAQGSLNTSQSNEKFHAGLYSWNAGTLGLSAAAAAFLPDVYSLTNKIYQATGWHTSEQNAFGLLLQTRTQLIPTSPYIHHYWSGYEKRAMDSILQTKLTNALADLPLAERIRQIKQWATTMALEMQSYFAQNRTLQLQMSAVHLFTNKQIFQAYRHSFAAIMKSPTDIKFIKDVLYHTKRLLIS